MTPSQLPRTVPQKNIVRTIRIDPSKMGAGLQSQLLASVSTARNARRISFAAAAAAAAPASPAAAAVTAATTTATVVCDSVPPFPPTATPAPTALPMSGGEPDPAAANPPSPERLAHDNAVPAAKPPLAAGASTALFRRKKVVPIVVAKKLTKKQSPAPSTPATKTEGEETTQQNPPVGSESSQSEALNKIDVEIAPSSAAPAQPKPVAFRRVKPKVSLSTAIKTPKTVTKRIDPLKDSAPEVTDCSQRQGVLSTDEGAPKISVEAEVNTTRTTVASLQTDQNQVTKEAVTPSQEQVIAMESHQKETVDPVVASHARSKSIKDGARIVESETAIPGDLAQEDSIANNLLLDSQIDLAKVENITVAIGNVNETAVPTHTDKENLTHPHPLHTSSGTSSQPGLPCATLSSADCNRPPEETAKKIPVVEKTVLLAQSPITAKTTAGTPPSGSKMIKKTYSLGKLLPPELANKLKNSLALTSSTKRKPAVKLGASKTNTENAPNNTSGHNIDDAVFDQSSDKKALPISYNEVVAKQTDLPFDGLSVKTNGSSATVACSNVSSSVPSVIESASKNDLTSSVESLSIPEPSCSLKQKVVADETLNNETTSVSSLSGTSNPQKGNAKPTVTPHPSSTVINLSEATCTERLEKSNNDINPPTITTAPATQSQITVLTTSANTPSTPPVQQKLHIISQIILPTINFTPAKASQPTSPGLSGSGTATDASGSPEISPSAFVPFPSRSPPSPSAANPTVFSSNLARAGTALPFLVSPDFRLMRSPFSSTSTPHQRLNDVVPMASGSGSKLIVPQKYPGAASEMYPKILVLHRPGLAKAEEAPISTSPQPSVPRIVIDRSYIGETEQPMECTSSIDEVQPAGDHEQLSSKGCSEPIRDMLRKKALKNLHNRGEKVPEAGSTKKQLQIPVPRYGRCYSNSARHRSRSSTNTGTPYISVATADGRKEYVKLEDHIIQGAKVPSGPLEVNPFGISTVAADGKNSDNEFYGYSDKMLEWENAKVDAKIRFIDRVVEQMVPIPATDGQTTSESDTDDDSTDETLDVASDTEETIDEPGTGPSLNDARSTVSMLCVENTGLVPQEPALTDTNAQNSAVIDIQNAPIIIPLGGQKNSCDSSSANGSNHFLPVEYSSCRCTTAARGITDEQSDR
uniref:Putative mucin-5ac n=1 Tax=Anopheles marajoara TaxID=58244 RepID=A0A2M4BAT0_9DIPT